MDKKAYNYRSTTYLLAQSATLIRNTWLDPELKRSGITSAQYTLLSVIKYNPGMSSAELARYFFITPQTMGSILSQLEERKLIRREENPENRRLLSVCVTPRGEELLEKCDEKMKSIEEELFEDFDEESLAQLKGYLTTLYAKVKKRNQ